MNIDGTIFLYLLMGMFVFWQGYRMGHKEENEMRKGDNDLNATTIELQRLTIRRLVSQVQMMEKRIDTYNELKKVLANQSQNN